MCIRDRSWDAAVTALQDVPFPRLGSTRKPPDPDVRDRVKAQRDACLLYTSARQCSYSYALADASTASME